MNGQRIESALRGGPPFERAYRSTGLVLPSADDPRAASYRVAAIMAVLVVAVAAALTLVPRFIPGPGTPIPATLEQLTGPIQPRPFVLSSEVLADIEHGCKQDREMPASARIVMIDARGGGVAHVWVHSFDLSQRLWDCEFPIGPASAAGDGGVTGPHPETIGPGQLRWADPQFEYLLVQAGAGIEAVQIVVDGGPTLLATRNGVWFAAYWAVPPQCELIAGLHRCPDVHYRAIGLDASGTVVNEIEWYSPGDAPPGWTYPPQ